MSTENAITGGFVGTNNGHIEDCYSFYTSATHNSDKAFAGKNTGIIIKSFASSAGSITDLHNDKGHSSPKNITGADKARSLGYDMEGLWEYTGGKNVMKFIDKNWHSDITGENKRVRINNLRDFEIFITSVNKGDERVLNSHFLLTADINCKGKTFPVIGSSRQKAFAGIFDGGGHSIFNFSIAGDSIGSWGLFSYLLGTIANLSIDCKVKGEGNIGALCGINEGLITCCGAVCNVRAGGDKMSLGGLVGLNRGRIIKSYTAVRFRRMIIPIIPISLMASGFALVGTIAFLTIPAAKAIDQPYAPVVPDHDQIIIKDDEAKEEDSSGTNSLSFRFNETVRIDSKTGNCYLDFRNPSNNPNMLVVSLYADNESETLIAESGAINPGYGLSYLKLNKDGYAAVKSGVRKGHVLITAYSKETNDKAMVDSELPVQLTIE